MGHLQGRTGLGDEQLERFLPRVKGELLDLSVRVVPPLQSPHAGHHDRGVHGFGIPDDGILKDRHVDDVPLHLEPGNLLRGLHSAGIEVKPQAERMHEVAIAGGVGGQPERERAKLQLLSALRFGRQQLAGLLRLGIGGVADREVWQRRRPHRDRHLLRRVAHIGAERDRITLDLHDVASDLELGALCRNRAICPHGEDMVAGPDRVVPRLEVGLRHGQAVDVFALVIPLEDRLAVEQHVSRPAGVVDADLFHLHAIGCGDRIDDRPLLHELIDRLAQIVERHELQLHRGGRQRQQRDEHEAPAEAGAGSP